MSFGFIYPYFYSHSLFSGPALMATVAHSLIGHQSNFTSTNLGLFTSLLHFFLWQI